MIQKDMEKLQNFEFEDQKIIDLINALEHYAESRDFDRRDSKELVDMLYLLLAILDVTEDTYDEFLSRLNVIQLKKMRYYELKNI